MKFFYILLFTLAGLSSIANDSTKLYNPYANVLKDVEQALERAQSQAEQLGLTDLLEVLSQGVRFTQPVDVEELILVPVFWTTPLIIEEKVTSGRQ